MLKRRLGQSPLEVAPLAFGGNVFGWSADERRSFELLDTFVDAGFNLIDTADVYSAWVPGNRGGESEAIIGRWLRHSGKRDQVLLATKVGKWAEHPGLRWRPRCSACRPITSTCTRHTRTTPACRWPRRSARSDG